LRQLLDLVVFNTQLKQVDLTVHPKNELVQVNWISPEFHLVGKGTDAVVIQHPSFPHYVFKVYAPQRLYKLPNEFTAYQKLKNSSFFPTCYFKGENYLILSYEKGPTLYDCLLKGIFIPERVIEDVERARFYVRNVGLNPRDIHLRNVLLQNGLAKIVDVSEFVHPGEDKRWDHLLQGYKHYYPLIKGKKIPIWLMEGVKRAYDSQDPETISIEDFGKQFLSWILHTHKQ